MKRTAIYIRVSTDIQAKEGDSIPAQREALLNYIQTHPGLVLAGEYIDGGVSGQKAKRDELTRLLDDVQAGKIDLIAFCKLDRWYRSVRHYSATQEILDKHKVEWLAIHEPIYDTTTPAGRLIVNQMMSIAQFEAENTGARIRAVNTHKIEKGEVLSGHAPHGYVIKKKKLEPGPTAPSVVAAFEAYSRTGSLNEAMRLTEDLPGLPTFKHRFKAMLQNPKYYGHFRGNDSYCPPLVSKDLWDDVQRQLAINIKQNTRHEYVFTGLIRCADCGRRMGASTRQKKRSISHLYRCPSAYEPRRLCGNRKMITEMALEKHLIGQLRPELENVIRVELEEAPLRPVRAKEKRAKIERKMERLKELYLADLIDLEEFITDRDEFLDELDKLKLEDEEPKKDIEAIRRFLERPIEDLYWEMEISERRQFWRGIIDHISLDKERNISVHYLRPDPCY